MVSADANALFNKIESPNYVLQTLHSNYIVNVFDLERLSGIKVSR